eukprot:scaffold33396_cov45-Attheya_sp.AAC.2
MVGYGTYHQSGQPVMLPPNVNHYSTLFGQADLNHISNVETSRRRDVDARCERGRVNPDDNGVNTLFDCADCSHNLSA